jgi:LPXTG-motif cell wall-anchored protein
MYGKGPGSGIVAGGAGTGVLASTGFSSGLWIAVAAILLLAGAALVLVAKRNKKIKAAG